VWSLNGQRRDLSADQRAQIWLFCNEHSEAWKMEQARITEEANRKRSEAAKAQPREGDKFAAKNEQVVGQSVPPPATPPDKHKSKNAAAQQAKVNVGAIARAEALAKARPDLAEKVRTGEIKPVEARRLAKKDKVMQKAAALPDDKFNVIYADPPWSYNDKQSGTISESYGAAEKHYPSMSMAELSALDIPSLTADDGVLFLWATSPMLPDALDLAKAWGFKYKASFVWDKVRHNMGHYNSVRHEFLLICTKGSGTPQVAKLYDSVQSIERTDKHSEKPEEFRQIIESLYPNGRKVELFARSPHDGWTCWGNEV
jgi:N6-adenosine-specific RNA methylase IME4